MTAMGGKVGRMSAQMPAAVLWDMDGTIVDSEHYWMRAELELAAKYGADWGPDSGLELVGLSLYESAEIMKRAMGIVDMSGEHIIDFLTERVTAQLRNLIPWRPGAKELLQELKAAGVPNALVTMSMRRNALVVVENLGFDCFDVVVAGDDVSIGKPHPEPYLKAAELLGVDPKLCVSFEDSVNGITSAEAAGTVAIGVPHFVQIPQVPNRTLWSSLAGRSIEDVARVFQEKRG